MLAYRSNERLCDPASTARTLMVRARRALDGTSHDDVRGIFIDFGELESAIADWVFPERDGLHPLTETLGHGALSTAHALLGSWTGDPDRRAKGLLGMLRCLEGIDSWQLPRSLPLRVSEGYAYYSLHPETYALAAARFLAERAPGSVVCLGIRSIGTSLSGVVAAAIDQAGIPVARHTVRPHGHPFERRLALADDLSRLLRARALSSCHFLVVDEGPGLSGSSFASVAAELASLGVGPERIALFPSWNADGRALRSDAARQIWATHRHYVAEASDAGFGVGPTTNGAGAGWVDFSGGAWRMHLLGDEAGWPAVQPQHEVAKAWLPADGSIVRFAGLGRYGAAKQERAERLAGAGLGPDPESLANGYLRLRFVEGKPCTVATPSLVDRIADHLAFLVRTFPSDRSPGVADLEEMIETNMRLGVPGVPVPNLAACRSALTGAPAAAIDGRMLPHEWIDTGSAYVKVDALDHHADHFFPGIQDAGWDLAGAAFEFGLDDGMKERLAARYASASGDRDIRARLPFYDVAYAAFRLGYATLALGSVTGLPDARRFAAVIARCGTQLRQLAATGGER